MSDEQVVGLQLETDHCMSDEQVLASDAYRDGRLVTRRRSYPPRGGRRATRNPFEVRMEGGVLDGDSWRFPSAEQALEFHAVSVWVWRRERPGAPPHSASGQQA